MDGTIDLADQPQSIVFEKYELMFARYLLDPTARANIALASISVTVA